MILSLTGIVLFFGNAPGHPVRAQEGGQVRIAPVDAEAFPRMTCYMDARTAEGELVTDLTRQEVTVIENGVRIVPDRLELQRPGAQFVLAISPGNAFTIRNSQGVSRYEFVAEAIAVWGRSNQGTNLDDLSFIASESQETTHQAEISQWMEALGSYQPPEEAANPEVDILARAIDLAADPTPRMGMGRAVLFVTALPNLDVAPVLENLAARANQLGVRVFVWLVSASDQFVSPGAGLLSELASSTGGSFFAFSGQEPIPDLEEYLEKLRSTYQLDYESQVITGGLHQVSVEVSGAGIDATSLIQEFELEILPPSIAFISPPMDVVRTAPEEQLEDPAAYSPKTVPLKVLIEFPDDHNRPLKQTSLFVDGVSVQSNTSEPFDQFSWDLTAYTSTAEHVLVVEAVDSLDLVGRSVEINVPVTLDLPARNPLAIVSQNRSILSLLAVVIAGAVLVLVLVRGGRLRPGFARELRSKRRRSDPVTQPVPVRAETPGRQKPTWMDRLPWPQRTVAPKAFAYMVPIGESGQDRSIPPLSISREEETFGREPDQVTQRLDDASVESFHARLVRNSSGEFRIMDEGSVAGTWVNYTPISKEGVALEHGDLVHFGRLGFRFVLREPVRVRKPVVKPGERFS